jgi:hypothetical protein
MAPSLSNQRHQPYVTGLVFRPGLLEIVLNVVAPADEKKLWAADTGWRNRDIIAAAPEISCPL